MDPKPRERLTIGGSVPDHPLLHLRATHIASIDAAIHRITSGFGFVTVKVAHGRVVGYDVQESIRVLDELAGQGRGAA